jgi:thiamine-monophosphate kinase
MNPQRIGDLGEAALIRRIRERFPPPPGVLGIGDDAAVFDVPAGHSVVFCSDLLAENAHFVRDRHPADSLGYKAVAVNVSDVGAMGGIPMYLVLSLAAPSSLDVAWLDRFYAGVERACAEFSVSLAGGDSSTADRIFIDVAMVGRVAQGQAVRRSGAQSGDGIYVTGTLGASARDLEQLLAGRLDSASTSRHLYPQPRHRVGAALAGVAHAMIDVSDGLSTDLNHIVEESRVAARISKDRIPRAEGATDLHLLHGGEDYELLIVAPQLPSTVEGVPLTRIGEIIPAQNEPTVLLVDDGRETPLVAQGWQHFS